MEALAEASQHLTPKTLIDTLTKAEVPTERKEASGVESPDIKRLRARNDWGGEKSAKGPSGNRSRHGRPKKAIA